MLAVFTPIAFWFRTIVKLDVTSSGFLVEIRDLSFDPLHLSILIEPEADFHDGPNINRSLALGAFLSPVI